MLDALVWFSLSLECLTVCFLTSIMVFSFGNFALDICEMPVSEAALAQGPVFFVHQSSLRQHLTPHLSLATSGLQHSDTVGFMPQKRCCHFFQASAGSRWLGFYYFLQVPY